MMGIRSVNRIPSFMEWLECYWRLNQDDRFFQLTRNLEDRLAKIVDVPDCYNFEEHDILDSLRNVVAGQIQSRIKRIKSDLSENECVYIEYESENKTIRSVKIVDNNYTIDGEYKLNIYQFKVGIEKIKSIEIGWF